VFFVTAPNGRGRPAAKRLALIETFLVQAGVAANPDLLNVRGTKKADWAIRGVIRGQQGRPSEAANQFRLMMKIP
jgi:hypothetical protein